MKKAHLPRAGLLVAGALAAIAAAWAILGLASAGEPSRLGDANCDGNLTSIDALLVLQLHAGLIDEVCGEVDVTGDGEVNSIDALFLLYICPCPIFPLTPAPTEAPPAPTATPTIEPSGGLSTYVQMSDLPNNEGIFVALTLFNDTAGPITRGYMDGQDYDVVVRDAEGEYVWNAWHDQPWTQAIEWQTFEPGESLTYQAAWRFEDRAGNDVGPGTYELEVFDVGCTTDPTRQCDLGETIAVDIPFRPTCPEQGGMEADLIVSGGRETFASGENVSLTLLLFNCGGTSTTREYSSSQKYDFAVQNEAGQVIWRWSHGRVFSAVVSDRTFLIRELVLHRTIWRQDTDERPVLAPELFGGGDLVAPGTYTILGFDVSTCSFDSLDSCDLIASQTIEIVP